MAQRDLRSVLLDRIRKPPTPSSAPGWAGPFSKSRTPKTPDFRAPDFKAQNFSEDGPASGPELTQDLEDVPLAPTGLPALPPNPTPRLPPAWKRYMTGLKMQDAYANDWRPNPILLRILEGME